MVLNVENTSCTWVVVVVVYFVVTYFLLIEIVYYGRDISYKYSVSFHFIVFFELTDFEGYPCRLIADFDILISRLLTLTFIVNIVIRIQ